MFLEINQASLLALLDKEAVIIHGHSVKGFQQVVCCENANETSSGSWTTRNVIENVQSIQILSLHDTRNNNPITLMTKLYKYQNTIMMASDPPVAHTEFIRNIEARVLANMQSAPPQDNWEYGLPKKGKPKK